MSAWSAIVGAAGTNKSEVARRVVRALAERGLRVGGFLQVDVPASDGTTEGWDVEHVADGERLVLARRSPDPTLCEYAFREQGFAQAAAWAREACDVVMIGGVGKLEAARGGHWPVLEALVTRADAAHVVACVRDSSLAAVALALPDPVAHVMLPCSSDAIVELADQIARAVRSVTPFAGTAR
jgi:nucleoside-triphosphatase THEP1